MKRRTFEKLVALLRPVLERDYCKNSVPMRFRRHSKLICTEVLVAPIKYVCVFYKCYNRWTDSVCVADGHI